MGNSAFLQKYWGNVVYHFYGKQRKIFPIQINTAGKLTVLKGMGPYRHCSKNATSVKLNTKMLIFGKK